METYKHGKEPEQNNIRKQENENDYRTYFRKNDQP